MPQPPPAPARSGRNSPFAIFGVLVVVLGLVGAVALPGIVSRPVAGFASPARPGDAGRADAPEQRQESEAAPRAVHETAANPLLAAEVTLAEVTCELPALSRSAEALTAYYQATIGCLDEAWSPALAAVREPFETAGLEVVLPSDSACGDAPSKEEALAYYCSGDRVIYMPRDRLLEDAGVDQALHLSVLAHEYGHHVQELSGIMAGVEKLLRPLENGGPEELELTRRIELQANCFGGLFVAGAAGRGAITKALGNRVMAGFGAVDGSDSHGTRKHQVKWAQAGFETGNLGACNTFAAPAEEVS
ncbi:neutral zinc metallopeptidase [Amycolatopsis nigrescens]|uniref:neutral zinc metallopeptidase n=1 Tax=Amycolatopsis nigrescens TaxID=381445 RepID=UPI00035DF2D4|nr:neutral zinc metallopeptidase [Amycolatopsis nigrescens]